MIKTYKDLVLISDFLERYKYARCNSMVGDSTFGFDRWLNQYFYHSPEWRELRQFVILRDEGLDLAHPDHPISGPIYVHHLNPISKKDIVNRSEFALNPDYFVCVSFGTHQAIHYGDESLLPVFDIIERTPYDTCPWRRDE